jgi:hypothetical protein
VWRDEGISDTNALHSWRGDYDAVLFAFDLIEYQGNHRVSGRPAQRAAPGSKAAPREIRTGRYS